jgi:hypothetical protein
MPKVHRHRVLLSTADLYELRRRVETPGSVEADAWAYHKKNRCDIYLDDAPNPVQRSGSGDYIELDADSRKARNLAVGYAVTGDDDYAQAVCGFIDAWLRVDPAVGDEQCAYHQAYGAWSFAFAFDLIRPVLGTSIAFYEAWFHRWSDAYKAMMDRWATNYYFTHTKPWPYSWDATKFYDRQQWYEGRDATLAPVAAWLAAATVSGYREHVDIIFDTHRLKVPTILHASCAMANDGDGLGTVPAPQCEIGVSSCDYMTYNARIASMLYQQAKQWGRAGTQPYIELMQTWKYLRTFPPPMPTPNGSPFTTSLYWPRMQMAKRLFGIEMVTTPSLYESQFLGPVTLTQFAP